MSLAGDRKKARTFQLTGPPTTWLKTDIWSVGAIAACMWCGHVPAGLDNPDLACTPQGLGTLLLDACMAEGTKQPDPYDDWPCDPPEGLLQLLTGCLARDPGQRSSAQQLLGLPWFEPERRQVLDMASQRPPEGAGSWGPALEALVASWVAAGE